MINNKYLAFLENVGGNKCTFPVAAPSVKTGGTISNIDATLEATYVTVAEGSTLPDVENITVTLGFVATMASPENQSLRVSRVNLIRYQ